MGLIRFCKNIIYLFKYNLKEIKTKNDTMVDNIGLSRALEHYKYELKEENLDDLQYPNIKSHDETIDYVIKNKCSMTRFGDGEFYLMINKPCIFQKADKKLAQRLIDICWEDTDGIITGGFYCYFHDIKKLNPLNQEYIRTSIAKNLPWMMKFYNPQKQYYSSAITQLYALFKNYDFENYFTKIKQIWENRDITIVCGKTVFDKLEYNIFDCAKSIEYVYAPRKNAWSKYNKILKECLKINKDRLVIIILGPTATVLAYDLHKEGYQAMDFGHIAKDYDSYMHKQDMSDRDKVYKFFKPD